jgi:hypothetical protein
MPALLARWREQRVTIRAMAEAASTARSGREEVRLRLLPWLGGTDEFERAWEIWGEFWHASYRDDEVRALLRDAWEEWLQLILEAIDRGKLDGSIPSHVEAMDAARRVAALLESLGQQLTTDMIRVEDARRLLHGAIEWSSAMTTAAGHRGRGCVLRLRLAGEIVSELLYDPHNERVLERPTERVAARRRQT